MQGIREEGLFSGLSSNSTFVDNFPLSNCDSLPSGRRDRVRVIRTPPRAMLMNGGIEKLLLFDSVTSF